LEGEFTIFDESSSNLFQNNFKLKQQQLHSILNFDQKVSFFSPKKQTQMSQVPQVKAYERKGQHVSPVTVKHRPDESNVAHSSIKEDRNTH
jgi:hypothetical protein